MSGDTPDKSPSILVKPPKRGPGVRRLNSVPLFIAGGAVAMVMGAVGYTYHDRLSHQNATAAQSEHKPEPGNGASVLSNAPSGSDITPASLVTGVARKPSPAAAASNVSGPTAPSDTPQPTGTGADNQEDAATKARRAAWEAYYAQVAEVQKGKFEDTHAALLAPLSSADHPASPAGAQQSAAPASYAGQQGQPPAPGYGSQIGPYGGLGGVGGYEAQNYPPVQTDIAAQAEKQQFLHKPTDLSGASDELQATIHPPSSPYMVMQGTVIPAIMDVGLNSDIPGQIRAHVSDPVYDDATGNYLLIPATSTLIGEYDNSVSQGQTRVAVIWHRIIFPDKSSISLGSMAGADQSGYSGFHDQVNTHLWSKLGNALLISVAGAGVQLSQGTNSGGNNGYNSQQIASAALGQQFSQLGQEYARAGLTIPNTLEIRPGYKFVVMANKDIPLRPYADSRQPRSQQVSFGPVLQ